MSTVQETVPETPAVEVAVRESKKTLSISRVASLIALILMIAAPLLVRNFVVFQFTMIIIYGIAIMSLNILTGASGQFSLGHSAFFAVGAYTTAILIEHAGMNYLLTLPFAGAVCFIFGFLFGLPALRLSGVYLALATFSLAIAMPQLLKLGTFEHFTGGVQGLVVTKPDAPFGLIDQDRWLYYVTLGVALTLYVLSVNLLNSRSGRALMSIRDNQIAASAMGINLALYKTLAFGISAGMTGVAGGLGAIAVAFVAPDGYSITFANALFLGMVIGGVGWLPGSLAGAAFIVLVPNMAESISKGLSGAVFGVFIIAVIFLFPNGARQAAYLGAFWIRKLQNAESWEGMGTPAIAALILGILGGLFGLFIGLSGYSVAGIASQKNAVLIQVISIGIPIASLVGGGIAKSNAVIGGALMLLSAVGMVWLFGFNLFTAIALVLSTLGGALALFSVNETRTA